MGEITVLLGRMGQGDAQAREALYALLYDELHRLAHSRLRRHETVTLLDTTSLVHEAYMRLLSAAHLDFDDRGRFFAYVASVMRSVIVDEVRRRHAQRRGGDAEHVELEQGGNDVASDGDADQVLRVHEALEQLGALDATLAQVVEMRYFAGLSEGEIAQALGVSERSVRRYWDKARTLLFTALS